MSSDPTLSDAARLEARGAALRRVARGLVVDPGEADDLLQEAALLELTGRARPHGPFRAFWAGVLRNLARRRAREETRRRARQVAVAEQRSRHVESTADAVARIDVHARVLAAVRALPEPGRTAIVLRYLEGLPPRRIAARLDVPVETVKARLKRALAQLRRQLDGRHGGDRRAWLGALLSAGRLRFPSGLPVSGAGRLGGAMGIEGGRRLLVVGLAVVLLGGVGWLTAGPLLRSEPAEPTGPLLVEPPTAAPEAGADETATLRGAEDAGARSDPLDPAGPGVGTTPRADPAAPRAEASFSPTPLDEAGFAAAPPAQVASPFAPPPGTPALGAAPGPGGGGPTGHWTRFSHLPPRIGEARLGVLVFDQNEQPVPGAVVYLAPPATVDLDAVSFGDLRTLGTTDASGRLDVERLPAGAAVVAANLHGRLNGRRGLDVRHAQPVLLQAGSEARVVLRIPLVVAETGTLTGRVVDEEGVPIRSASVSTAFRREWTGADGRFRIEGVAAGPARLTVGATGRRTEVVPLELPAGGTKDTVVTLELADRGSLRLDGLARLPDGSPVAGAAVYLMVESERGTLRRTRTDEAGAFHLPNLPDRLREAACRLQVSGFPRYRTGMLKLTEGVRDEQVVVEVPGAYARVRLALRDAGTGEPVEIADVDFVGEETQPGGRRSGTLSFDRATGTWQGFFEGGRGTLQVTTLTHGSWERALDLPPEGGDVEVEARLARVAEDPVQIALDVRVLRRTDDAPVDAVTIEVLDASSGEPLSRFTGGRSDGRYRLPAPSGTRRLRVRAEGYETQEQDLVLDPAGTEVALEVRLTPRT